MENSKPRASAGHKLLTVIGIVLSVILIPMLVINITLIIKNFVNPDKVPSVAGYAPMIVLTDSMYPTIKSGDLIFCKTTDAEDIKEKDIITYFDVDGGKNDVVTHRVVEIKTEDGKIYFVTKGDANNTIDKSPIPAENLIGVYKTRIANAGNAALFMQTTKGLIICVVLPLVLLIGYDVIRRRLFEKSKKQDTDALLKELEALKAQNGEGASEDNSEI